MGNKAKAGKSIRQLVWVGKRETGKGKIPA